MIKKAVIIPTGNEVRDGIVLDTDSPMIMQAVLRMNSACTVVRNEPVADVENAISHCIQSYTARGYDLIVLIGGSGGGHRYSETLGRDVTHSSLETLLERKYSSELYGKNGHLWCKLLCGTLDRSLVINLPGPYEEAKAAMAAFVRAYEQDSHDLQQINHAMAVAVKSRYG